MKSKKPFKLHLYKVQADDGSKPLEEILETISETDLAERTRKLGTQPYRLEEVHKPTKEIPFWLADFTKVRYDGGPGKASEGTPVESFEMAGGYGFAEETAMLYDPNTDYVVMQYNHYGPRAQSISDYLSVFDLEQPNSYQFLLQLNATAQARLKSKTIFTRLKIRIAPAKLSDAFRKANVALVTALESQATFVGGDFVIVEVGLERENKGSLKLKKWLPNFIKMANQEPEAVSALTISGRDGVDQPIDPVDLIHERLETVIQDMPLDAGLRYPTEDRYKALRRAHNGWKKDGNIA